MQGRKPYSRARLAMTLADAWNASRAIGRRSIHGNPGSVSDCGSGAPEAGVSWTKIPAVRIKRDWSKNEEKRTQRLRSPKVRWKYAVTTEPRRNERTEATDFVQASLGEETGRLLTPRAAKIVLPVCFGCQ